MLAAAEQAIVAEQLVRSFGDDVVVDGVDLIVPSGEIFACVGPPGSGRSPLIRMLCGLLTPTSGKATVAGFDIGGQAHEVRRRVGAVMTGLSLDPRATGRQSLRFIGQLSGLGASLLEVAEQDGKTIEAGCRMGICGVVYETCDFSRQPGGRHDHPGPPP